MISSNGEGIGPTRSFWKRRPPTGSSIGREDHGALAQPTGQAAREPTPTSASSVRRANRLGWFIHFNRLRPDHDLQCKRYRRAAAAMSPSRSRQQQHRHDQLRQHRPPPAGQARPPTRGPLRSGPAPARDTTLGPGRSRGRRRRSRLGSTTHARFWCVGSRGERVAARRGSRSSCARSRRHAAGGRGFLDSGDLAVFVAAERTGQMAAAPADAGRRGLRGPPRPRARRLASRPCPARRPEQAASPAPAAGTPPDLGRGMVGRAAAARGQRRQHPRPSGPLRASAPSADRGDRPASSAARGHHGRMVPAQRQAHAGPTARRRRSAVRSSPPPIPCSPPSRCT